MKMMSKTCVTARAIANTLYTDGAMELYIIKFTLKKTSMNMSVVFHHYDDTIMLFFISALSYIPTHNKNSII